MYENKGSMDKITAKKSDIYGNLTWILQKNSGFHRQLSLIDKSRAGFVRIFAAKICPSPGSRTERAYSVSTGKRQDNAVQIVWRAWGWKGLCPLLCGKALKV